MIRKLFVLLFVMILAAAASAQEIKKMKIADVVKMIENSTEPLVVNFWASWCAPCIKEIPWFEKAVAKLKDKKVKLVLVSLDFADEYPKGIADFAKKNGYTSTIVWLNESNTDEFCKLIDASWDGAIPVTLMVNNKKKYKQFYKQQLPEAKLELELNKLIEYTSATHI